MERSNLRTFEPSNLRTFERSNAARIVFIRQRCYTRYLMEVYRQTFEGRKEQLVAIHEFVDRAATELGLSDDDTFACRLAVDEAATNAFEHAYDGQPNKVEVTIQHDTDHIVLRVRNWGQPFDPEAIPEPRLDLPLDARPVGGLGIFLMKKYMDQVSFESDAEKGNTVTMRRLLSSR